MYARRRLCQLVLSTRPARSTGSANLEAWSSSSFSPGSVFTQSDCDPANSRASAALSAALLTVLPVLYLVYCSVHTSYTLYRHTCPLPLLTLPHLQRPSASSPTAAYIITSLPSARQSADPDLGSPPRLLIDTWTRTHTIQYTTLHAATRRHTKPPASCPTIRAKVTTVVVASSSSSKATVGLRLRATRPKDILRKAIHRNRTMGLLRHSKDMGINLRLLPNLLTAAAATNKPLPHSNTVMVRARHRNSTAAVTEHHHRKTTVLRDNNRMVVHQVRLERAFTRWIKLTIPGQNHHAQGGAPPPPPTQPQGFGHGAPQGYNFQYSACNGRRKALLIGINYFGQRGQLRGCINDVKNMSGYLNQHFGYKREDMVTLTDDQQNPMSQPTKANILRAMHWLVKDARPNDSLFFHYSGHGGQTEDLDGDEDDGYDEVIYPVDFRTNGHIVDDEMHLIMVQSLQPGVRLTAIFDSCHSGSALDLPYVYSTQGVLKEPNLAKEAGQGLLGIVSSYARQDIGGMLSSATGLFKKVTQGDSVYKKNLQTKTSPADVIMWSGSKDTQTSADASIAGQATGAMSYAFITSLKKNPNQSYVQLLNSIRDELEGKYDQKPQLSCSHPLSMYLPHTISDTIYSCNSQTWTSFT
ncbi:unnamed protein product [Periconia digitata]|uniref:Peptidase C14 caspase domain-containing protein n=1 Tax=Periconia digitata TaxID=1303443 RepID=A0A9W4UQE0_9PLEO|nr:unnamed protein product [Periconia digitata]